MSIIVKRVRRLTVENLNIRLRRFVSEPILLEIGNALSRKYKEEASLIIDNLCR